VTASLRNGFFAGADVDRHGGTLSGVFMMKELKSGADAQKLCLRDVYKTAKAVRDEWSLHRAQRMDQG